MKILHISNGWEKWNGAANIARMIASEQVARGDVVGFKRWATIGELRSADEVWIHCGWMPCLWWAAAWARRAIWVPEACYDPIRLRFHGWKKCLVGPIERWALRRTKKLIACCEGEKAWIEAYLGAKRPMVEVKDIKKFFKFKAQDIKLGESGGKVHLLYLGRRHPLKGVEYLEAAVKGLDKVELKVASNAFGEEKERIWQWCNVLCLPTLSDNFGLVVAEALERGKYVITTDGAPAWKGEKGVKYIEGYVKASPDERVQLLRAALTI